MSFFFFFFNDTATTEIYTLSLHDALPISGDQVPARQPLARLKDVDLELTTAELTGQLNEYRAQLDSLRRQRINDYRDRKSTRLNSSHANISYAVFCLKKKKNTHNKNYH